MRRPNRNVSFLTMSALDLLAMATGTFVLLVVLMMPYYHRTFDANDEIRDMRADRATMQAETERAERASAAQDRDAERIEAEAVAAERAAHAAAEAAAKLERQAASLQARAQPAEPAAPERREGGDTTLVRQLDLVFVIDASGSMAEVIRELAASLDGIVRVLERLIPSLRVGFVAYRDYDVGSWVTLDLPPTPTADRLSEILGFARRLDTARVPGATPTEAVLAGLRSALAFDFRPGARQMVIVIGDAAAHPHEQADALALVRGWAAGGGKRSLATLFVATPAFQRFGQGDREFFQRLAEAGRGTASEHRGQMMESILMATLAE